jgi:hypothetical protein
MASSGAAFDAGSSRRGRKATLIENMQARGSRVFVADQSASPSS